MTIRKRLFTAAAITLSIAIAICGWVLTNALIDKKTNEIFKTSGLFSTSAQQRDEPISGTEVDLIKDETPEPPGELPKLTDYELIAVLRNWEDHGYEALHEPMTGQISMEDAISIGETALSAINIAGITPEESLAYDKTKTTAHLYQNIPRYFSTAPYYAPIYSYWCVAFRGGSSSAHMVLTINAVTGQVLRYDILYNSYATIPFDLFYPFIENTLNRFLQGLGISGNDRIAISVSRLDSPTIAYKDFADGELYAVMEIICLDLAINSDVSFTRVSIYATIQAP